ncbi:MAG TPA: phenylalanine--tRNA ligase subunit beta [Polyangiaceae bacterium]|nr:phenylalanine--tRNA ligase subunit beta [Polyangiaceae bacterium]
MKASLNWLRELLPALNDLSPTQVAERLTSAGLEVEGVHAYGEGSLGCVVARVVSMRPHPTKSGLRLVTVDAGGAPQELVCGAPNVPDPGGLVVLAKLGAHLPAKNMTIARREIAGVVSEGMLCSESELGLSEEGGGILVLPTDAGEPGQAFAAAIPAVNDVVFEIGLTPNRPDGLGHVGLARELGAVLGVPFRAPLPPRFGDEASPFDVVVHVHDPERCPEYAAATVHGVRVGPSPLAWRYRLLALGVRPISNVVDVTNLVLLEHGQPMHAFDLAKVRGAQVHVRAAREGEPFTTLDGVARQLTADDLVVCDGEGPVALAGVMGGANSEISPETRAVLLECAYFDPRGVRRASRRHGLHTESSHRFERGTDPAILASALGRCVELLGEVGYASATLPRYVHGASVVLEPRRVPRPRVRLRAAFMRRVLGLDLPFMAARVLLERLGCDVEPEAGADEALVATVPTHRPDLTREIDLVEEVVRVHGIDRVASDLPAVRGTREHGPREATERRVRALAAGAGLSETITFRFTSPRALAAACAPVAAVELANPINDHQTVMRTSLLPGLLEAVASARRHGVRSASLFALGPIFLPATPGDLPEERPTFTAVLSGERSGWLTKPAPVDVWDAKGVAVALVQGLTGRTPEASAYPAEERPRHLHPRAAGRLTLGGAPVGRFGLLHPDVVEDFDAGELVAVVELFLPELEALPRVPAYRAIPRFPSSSRDLALVVHDDVAAGAVLAAIRAAAGPLAEDVEVFDRFVGPGIPADHASLAFRVVYRAEGRTLTDAEVDKCHAQVVALAGERFGATLRA